MQLAMSALAITAGMVFSLAIALLVEEFIFGKVLSRFFVQQTSPVKPGRERQG
jgi:hypothetical protein